MTKKIGVVLVLIMTILQAFYAAYAYIDPIAFSALRGTDLVSVADADWVKIYASRTLFISLIVGLLLYLRNYAILFWVAVFGIVMPVTDALLAYEAGANFITIFKHIATVVYLIITAVFLKLINTKYTE